MESRRLLLGILILLAVGVHEGFALVRRIRGMVKRTREQIKNPNWIELIGAVLKSAENIEDHLFIDFSVGAGLISSPEAREPLHDLNETGAGDIVDVPSSLRVKQFSQKIVKALPTQILYAVLGLVGIELVQRGVEAQKEMPPFVKELAKTTTGNIETKVETLSYLSWDINPFMQAEWDEFQVQLQAQPIIVIDDFITKEILPEAEKFLAPYLDKLIADPKDIRLFSDKLKEVVTVTALIFINPSALAEKSKGAAILPLLKDLVSFLQGSSQASSKSGKSVLNWDGLWELMKEDKMSDTVEGWNNSSRLTDSLVPLSGAGSFLQGVDSMGQSMEEGVRWWNNLISTSRKAMKSEKSVAAEILPKVDSFLLTNFTGAYASAQGQLPADIVASMVNITDGASGGDTNMDVADQETSLARSDNVDAPSIFSTEDALVTPSLSAGQPHRAGTPIKTLTSAVANTTADVISEIPSGQLGGPLGVQIKSDDVQKSDPRYTFLHFLWPKSGRPRQVSPINPTRSTVDEGGPMPALDLGLHDDTPDIHADTTNATAIDEEVNKNLKI